MNHIPDHAYSTIKALVPTACNKMNTFSAEILKTRGGRVGSGMGALLEALWGYMMNQALLKENIGLEIAWFPDHQYNDFACLEKEVEWNEVDGTGEVFRIETKSMNTGADESKAHFDVLLNEIHRYYDSLLILVWEWKHIDSFYYSPQVVDAFFNRSSPIAILRDILHEARGGTFVDNKSCPDGCLPKKCSHSGEPLNAFGKRERLSGPENTRPLNVSYAANFGGLVRMLKTKSENSRKVFRARRKNDDVADEYISFIHRNFPGEEINQYTIRELRTVAHELGISDVSRKKSELMDELRQMPNYMQALRNLMT